MFEIYGRNNCIYCEYAKKLLTDLDYEFIYHNIEESKELLEEFKYIFNGAKTVPQIVVGMNDEIRVIGGYEDLVKWLSTQKS
jgi:glutaredoxin